MQSKNNDFFQMDLHIHTTNSDGERTVPETIQTAYEQGMNAIAITDHNTISTEKPISYHGMMVIPGCEFSTVYYATKEKKEIHIIGLFPKGINPSDFDSVFDRIDKLAYIKAIIKNLNRLGIKITLEDVLAHKKASNHIGRQILAETLVEKEYAKNKTEAMDIWVGNNSVHYMNACDYIDYPRIEDIVPAIIKNHGIPILCHPFSYHLKTNEIYDLANCFRNLVPNDKTGGMEVYYQKYMNDAKKILFLENLARHFNLCPSVSSDNHHRETPFSVMRDERGRDLYDKLFEKNDGISPVSHPKTINMIRTLLT